MKKNFIYIAAVCLGPLANAQVAPPAPELRFAKVTAAAIRVNPVQHVGPLDRSTAPVRPLKANELRLERTTIPLKPAKIEPASLRHRTANVAAWKAASVDALRPMSPFRAKLLTRWNPAHGEMMQTMLTRITAAEKAGDTETYKRLTETYGVWAEKYLVRDAPAKAKQNP